MVIWNSRRARRELLWQAFRLANADCGLEFGPADSRTGYASSRRRSRKIRTAPIISGNPWRVIMERTVSLTIAHSRKAMKYGQT